MRKEICTITLSPTPKGQPRSVTGWVMQRAGRWSFGATYRQGETPVHYGPWLVRDEQEARAQGEWWATSHAKWREGAVS